MKKVLVVAIAAASILTSCCGGGSGMKTVTKLNTLTDSVSYAYGAFIGENIRTAFGSENEDLDVSILAGAIHAAIKDKSITSSEMNNAILQNYFTNIKPAKDKAVDTDFLANIEKKSNVKKTESGLLYQIIEEGDQSLMPSGADTVMTIYTGTFSNGEEFDSTEKHGGEPAPFVLGSVIPGFSEGLQLIGKGGKIKLWIPAEMAYGDKLMIFDVEIADVKKVN